MLYEQSSLDGAFDLVKDWTAAERQQLRDDVPKQGLKAMIRGRTVRDVARDVVKLAHAGLAARNQTGCKGKTETTFLEVLDETVASGKTAADQMLELYNSSWNRDITRVFRDFAY